MFHQWPDCEKGDVICPSSAAFDVDLLYLESRQGPKQLISMYLGFVKKNTICKADGFFSFQKT